MAGKTDDQKIYYHKIGTTQKEDKIIYAGKPAPIRYVSAGVSENQKWLFLYCANSTYGNSLLVTLVVLIGESSSVNSSGPK